MREHQIVISLKPDQFEEVQRMARAAGSKSVGLFVRQKLIGTLGLGITRAEAGEDPHSPDLKQLTGELRRLHRELQIFVADSLIHSDYAMPTVESSIPFPTAVQENFLAEGAPLMPESMELSYRADNISIPFNEVPPNSMTAQPNYSSASGMQQPVPGMQSASGMQPAYSIAPDPNQPTYELPPDSLHIQPAYSVPEAPPETTPIPSPNSTPTQTQPPLGSSVHQAVSQNMQSFSEHDELEDLAERAFAISPRLGPLEESVKRFPDPLQDLLDEGLIAGDDEEESEDASEEESSQSSDHLGMSASDAADASAPTYEFGSEGAQEDVANPEQEAAETGASEENFAEHLVQSEPETASDPEDEPSGDDPHPGQPPQIPPPLSGGPPPRKSRT
jgi:hypothetical protein